ncbi:MAG: autotransporter outer membrane beta-barrel domain-containing protein [Puniceicoccales bacterium]|jgi:outer membrane autotransporter protein|nr:autotransporter outer membrane beta-barrel domain-containing protein [Puniceicoccales bacterium]
MCDGWLAGEILVNGLADLQPFPEARELAVFCVLDGGMGRYKTGSHTEVRGPSSLAGLSLGVGPVVIGGFLECAHGSVRTKNDGVEDNVEFRGKGKSTAVGGGVLARANIHQSGSSLFFCECAGRAGSVHNSWDGDNTDPSVTYDKSEPYFGCRAGAGYRTEFCEKYSAKLYGNYFWSHLSKESDVAGGLVSFGSMESHRLQLGSQINYSFTENLTPWFEACFEHEFKGTIDGVASEADIPNPPSLKGSCAVCKLGMTYRPFSTLRMDLSLRGIAGHRNGLNLSFQLDGIF